MKRTTLTAGRLRGFLAVLFFVALGAQNQVYAGCNAPDGAVIPEFSARPEIPPVSVPSVRTIESYFDQTKLGLCVRSTSTSFVVKAGCLDGTIKYRIEGQVAGEIADLFAVLNLMKGDEYVPISADIVAQVAVHENKHATKFAEFIADMNGLWPKGDYGSASDAVAAISAWCTNVLVPYQSDYNSRQANHCDHEGDPRFAVTPEAEVIQNGVYPPCS